MADLLFTITNTGAASYQLYYRLRGTTDPWNGPFDVTADPGPTTQYTIQDVDPNEYEAYAVSVCADGSTSVPSNSFDSDPVCAMPTAFNAVVSGTDFIITYTVKSSVGMVQLNITYPNSGTFSQNYEVQSPYQITVPIPSGLYGDYLFSMRSVCNEDSDWYSDSTNQVLVEVTNPSSCTPPTITNSEAINSTVAATTYRFTLGGYTSSVRVVVDNNTTGTQQILTQAVVNNYVDIALPKGSISYNYTVSVFNLCQSDVDEIGDSITVVVGSSAPLVNVAGWSVGAGPDNEDINGDGIFGTMVTISTNGLPPDATRDCLVIVRFNCATSGYAYVNVTIPAGNTTGVTRDWNSACTVDTQSAFIQSATLL